MGTAVVTPVEEYLRSSWDPDREYVDGVVLERNLGELAHSNLQTSFWGLFRARGVHAVVELRTQVKPAFPDFGCARDARDAKEPVCTDSALYRGGDLSPEDRVSALGDK